MDVERGLRPAVDPWIDAAVAAIALGKELGIPAHEVARVAAERPDLIDGATAMLGARQINQRIEADAARMPGRGR